jgi:hypothetical protein
MIPKILNKVFYPKKIIIYWNDLKRLKNLGLNPYILIIYMFELILDIKFWKYIKNQIEKAQNYYNDPRLGGWLNFFEGILLYSIVRLKKPNVVVETGVGPGSTSALILRGLMQNSKGILYSIDLPGQDSIVYPQIGRTYNIHVPPGYEVGWLVPPWTRKRWKLILGDSREELPKLLSSGLKIDIFLHDSLHTDEHIKFELGTVIPYMEKDAFLLADDVVAYWSLAFIDFCASRGFPFIVHKNRLGVAVVR